MSLTAIFALIVTAIAALFGGIAGHGLGKSAGRKEGAQQAKAEQQATQVKAVEESLKERNNVEAQVSTASRADIDSELSEFGRPD